MMRTIKLRSRGARITLPPRNDHDGEKWQIDDVQREFAVFRNYAR